MDASYFTGPCSHQRLADGIIRVTIVHFTWQRTYALWPHFARAQKAYGPCGWLERNGQETDLAF